MPRSLHRTLTKAYLESGHEDLVELRFFDDVAHNLTGANQPVEDLSPAAPLDEAASTWLISHLNNTT